MRNTNRESATTNFRDTVRVILVNPNKEVLFMAASYPKAHKNKGLYWFPIGGGIEKNETPQEAAIREVYEETGIKDDEIELGPLIWFGESDIFMVNEDSYCRVRQRFFVATTCKTVFSLENFTEDEKYFVKGMEWFSLETIKNSDEIIYPVLLPQYLPDILEKKYPKVPINIELLKHPKEI